MSPPPSRKSQLLEFEEAEVSPSLPPPTPSFPEGGFWGWSTVAGATMVMFCTLGYVNSWGTFQEYFETHQLSDYSHSQIAWIGSLQVFFIFGSGLAAGPLFDRWGHKVIWPAAFCLVLSVMLASTCSKYWHFLLTQGFLGGISLGMTMSPAMAAVPHYFQRKRGMIMGIMVAGGSVGGVVWPILLASLFHHEGLGFGWSLRIPGLLMAVLLGLSVVGIRRHAPLRNSDFFLPSAFHEAEYRFCILACFCFFMGMFTPIFYLPSYARQHGMDSLLAFYLLAILNGASMPGRVLPGILADKFGRLNMLFAAALASGVVTFCWTLCKTNASIIVFSIVFGFCSGAIVAGISVSLASCASEPRNIGTYMGMGLFLASIAALISPPINGVLLVRDPTFEGMSVLSGVFLVLGSGAVVGAKMSNGNGVWARS